MISSRPTQLRAATVLLAAAAALAASAWFVGHKTRDVERRNPPRGRLMRLRGMQLHWREHGPADAAHTIVMLHGNGTMAEDIELSGVAALCAQRHRVLVFDRPGYGHSERPRGQRWSPEQQADLFHEALSDLGIERAIVLGHSWGSLVAMAMGLRHPQQVAGLVLVSGYYFPSLRLDSLLLSGPAIPVLGTLLRHTVSPIMGRLMWPLMLRRMFSPRPTSERFKHEYPVWMSLRPGQLHASASEAAQMIPAAAALRPLYEQLSVPTVMVAGAKDRLLSTRWHSGRLNERIERGWLRVIEDAGHMVHHAAPEQVAAAVDQVARLAEETPRAPQLALAANETVGA